MHNRRIRAVVVSCLIGTIALGALAAAIVFRDIVAAFLHTGSADLALAMLKLESPIAATRSTGARAIAKHGPAAHDAIPRLINALDDSDSKVVASARTALPHLGPAVVPQLAEYLHDPRTSNFEPALVALTKLGSAGLPPLVDLLKHERPGHRKAGAQGIFWMQHVSLPAPAIPKLVQLLEDTDADVRKMAESAIRRHQFGRASFVPLLVEKLQSRDTSVRIAVMELLKQQHSRAVHALPELVRGFTDMDPTVRIASLEAWSTIARDTPVAVDPLLPMADDPDPAVRKAAVMHISLWYTNQDKIDRTFVKALRDEEFDVRREAAKHAADRMMRSDFPVILIPALIVSLKDSEAEVRLRAADALMHASKNVFTTENERTMAVEALVVALNDDHSEVRATAGRSLGRLDPSTAGTTVPVLVKLLDDPDEQVRYSALVGLSAFGPQAEPAIPHLVRMSGVHAFRKHTSRVYVETFAKIGNPALPAVVMLLQHPNAETRRSAVSMLTKLGKLPEQCSSELIRRLQDVDADVRLAIVEVLLQLETRDESATKALEVAAEQDIDPRVRMRAVWALSLIEDEQRKANATAQSETPEP